MTMEHDDAERPMTRADAEELGLLRCVHAGHATGTALCAHLGLSTIHEPALDRVMAGMVERGLLDNDESSYTLTDDGRARLGDTGT